MDISAHAAGVNKYLLMFFPVCDCHLAGVSNEGVCSQEAETGVDVGDCACKSKTTGRTCDQCIPGYFNISAANPDGCQGETMISKCLDGLLSPPKSNQKLQTVS